MRARRLKTFRPDASPALEARIVLNAAGLTAPLAAEVVPISAAVGQGNDFRFPTEIQERSPLLDEISGQLNFAFAEFAEDYRALRTSYFEAVGALPPIDGDNDQGQSNGDNDQGQPNGAPGMPGQTPEGLAESFQQAIRQRADELGNRINSTLDGVQGGGGMLNNFGRARVDQLARELAEIDPIGVGQLNPAEYSLMGEYAIADSLFATRQFVQVYDAALFQTASGFFSGNLRFFRGGSAPTEQLSQVSPAVGPVIEGLNNAYSGLAQELRGLRGDYVEAIGDGNDNGQNNNGANNNRFENYRTAVADRAEELRIGAIEALNRPAGGAGALSGFATEQLNQVQLLLANLPPLGETPLGTDAHATLNEQIVARSLNDMRALVLLYDISLSTTAVNFFNANPRFATQGAGLPVGGGPGAGQVGPGAGQDGSGVGVAAQTGGFGGGQGTFPGGGFGGGQVTFPGGGFGGGQGTFPGGGFGGNQGAFPGGGLGGNQGAFPGGGLGGNQGAFPGSGFGGGQGTSFFGSRPGGFDRGLGFGGLGGGFNFGPSRNFGTGFGFGGRPFSGLGPAGQQFGQGLGFGTGGAFGLGNQFGVVAGPGLGTGLGFGGFFL